MPVMLQINNLRKRYGAVTILDDASASFSSDQKVGVIGRNGAGKSTLCKIITGQEEADAGTITRNSNLKLSYLDQHDPYRLDETVLEFLTRYTGKEEWQCGEIAGCFQIKHETLELKMAELPGGFRTRAKLAAMLLRDPNFLVLDEPTNYLDLSTLIHLENFLLEFRGAYLIVSHDREFLKRTCSETLEVENGRLTLYPGSIEDYFEFKEEQLAQKTAYNKNIEKKKGQLQEFVDRFKAKASTATRAKSKMKQIEKLKTIEIAHPMDNVHIKIPPVERKTGAALFCEDLAIGYPEKIVAQNIRMDIDRGARVAVLGDNGQGKTTLLRTLAGDLAPKTGGYRWGTALKVAYYAQHFDKLSAVPSEVEGQHVFGTLHPQDDVFSHLQSMAAPGITTQDVLNMAGSFLFKGDDVKKKISVLSGGERARLLLAGLLLTRSQILLLDEPTNHLDFETVESLGNALKGFGGTIFFISHDRTFVNLVATHILEVRNGAVKRYPGKYEDYVYHLECEARDLFREEHEAHSARHESSKPAAREDQEKAADEEKRSEKERRKKITAEILKIKSQLAKIDSRLKHFTQEKEALVQEGAVNPFHFSRPRNEKIKQLGVQIEQEEEAWLRLQSELENLVPRLD